MRSMIKPLAATPVLALLVAVALPAVAQEQAPDLAAPQSIQTPLNDAGWLPWLGCWQLSNDTVDSRDVESTGRQIVCIEPRLDGRGVNLTTRVDAEIIAENTVIADGTERALPESDCAGHQSASWSADGHRLHSAVEATCNDTGARSLTGLSMLVEGDFWVEIQSVSLADREHSELVVRLYEPLDRETTQQLGVATLDPARAARVARARAAATAPLDIDDVLETADAFSGAVVEAAILESGSMFALDTDALFRLADAGIDEGVIDLMVAVSFPDEFVVDTGSGAGGGGGAVYAGYTGWMGYYGYRPGFYGYAPGCWGYYYSPFYGPYGPGCGGYWYPNYYGGYRPPYWGGGPARPVVPPRGSLYGGRVINGRGYSTPRTATPRQQSSLSGVGSIAGPSSGSNGLGYTVRRAVPRNDRGDRVGSAAARARRNSGSVSRSGFSRPPSSTSGASSSGGGSTRSGTRTAKPRGGGSRGGGSGSGGGGN